MEELINESLVEMINDGRISMGRANILIYIKSFINRIATKNFIEEDAIHDIENKYGVRPNIVTWGDYFQTQMATSLMVLSDEEFERGLETLKFDMVASQIIFCEKDLSFFEWVDDTYTTITELKSSDYTEEEEEIIHLKILKDYYVNLGIVNNFTEPEMRWFTAFQEAEAI